MNASLIQICFNHIVKHSMILTPTIIFTVLHRYPPLSLCFHWKQQQAQNTTKQHLFYYNFRLLKLAFTAVK